MHSQNENASASRGIKVDLAGGPDSTNQIAFDQSSTDEAALQTRSTNTAIQRAKLLALLRQSPQTTIGLRAKGIMMPGVRVFELKKLRNTITTELITQYDEQGILHPRCARYHLVKQAGQEAQA